MPLTESKSEEKPELLPQKCRRLKKTWMRSIKVAYKGKIISDGSKKSKQNRYHLMSELKKNNLSITIY